MYEYKAIIVNDSIEKELNKWAKEGWEYVSLTPFSNIGAANMFFQSSSTSGFIMIFKRILPK